MKLTYKIPLIFIAIGFSTLIISFLISYQEISDGLRDTSYKQLTASRESKKREIENYFSSINQQLITFSKNLMVVESMVNFDRAFTELKTTSSNGQSKNGLHEYYQTDFLSRYREHYHAELDVQPLIPDTKVAKILQRQYVLKQAESDIAADYQRFHEQYHPVFEQYQQRLGYHDIFLINPQGDIVYSVFKEIDYATNLLHGGHRDSGLADVFKQALKLQNDDQVAIVDFESYIPSYGEPALFFASQVLDGDQLLGVVAMQVSIERIDHVMSNNGNWLEEGYGNSGETYIVSSDYGMRSNSRFLIEEPASYFNMLKNIGTAPTVVDRIRTLNTSILFQKIETDASRDALAGNSSTRLMLDYRGVPVLTSYSPLNISGLKWVLISEVDEQEAFAPLANVRSSIINFGLFLFVVLVLIAIVVAYRITSPLKTLVNFAKSISRDDFSKRIPVIKPDEIGELSRAFNDMSSTLEVTTVSKAYVDQVLHNMTDALFVIKSNSGDFDDLRITTVNKASLDLLGIEAEHIIYRTLDDYVLGGFQLTSVERTILMEKGEISGLEKVLVSRNGKQIPVLFSVSVMGQARNALKDSLTCVCMATDITERKRIETRLHLVSTAFNNSTEPAVIVDIDKCIVEANPAFEFICGVQRGELNNQPLSRVAIDNKNISLSSVIESTTLDNSWRGEITMRRGECELLPFLVVSTAVSEGKNTISHYVIHFSDITELKNREKRIINIASHDGLTGLPNRMLFIDRLEQTSSQSRRTGSHFALVFIDLDGFKAVNDNHGHQAGDELLVEVANRLQKQVRESDTVSRYGGDEFVVILPNISEDNDHILVSNRILDAIAQPYLLKATTAYVSASIGIAIYPTHAQDGDTLLEMADCAMYRAKKAGKNCIELAA